MLLGIVREFGAGTAVFFKRRNVNQEKSPWISTEKLIYFKICAAAVIYCTVRIKGVSTPQSKSTSPASFRVCGNKIMPSSHALQGINCCCCICFSPTWNLSASFLSWAMKNYKRVIISYLCQSLHICKNNLHQLFQLWQHRLCSIEKQTLYFLLLFSHSY